MFLCISWKQHRGESLRWISSNHLGKLWSMSLLSNAWFRDVSTTLRSLHTCTGISKLGLGNVYGITAQDVMTGLSSSMDSLKTLVLYVSWLLSLVLIEFRRNNTTIDVDSLFQSLRALNLENLHLRNCRMSDKGISDLISAGITGYFNLWASSAGSLIQT